MGPSTCTQAARRRSTRSRARRSASSRASVVVIVIRYRSGTARSSFWRSGWWVRRVGRVRAGAGQGGRSGGSGGEPGGGSVTVNVQVNVQVNVPGQGAGSGCRVWLGDRTAGNAPGQHRRSEGDG